MIKGRRDEVEGREEERKLKEERESQRESEKECVLSGERVREKSYCGKVTAREPGSREREREEKSGEVSEQKCVSVLLSLEEAFKLREKKRVGSKESKESQVSKNEK